MIKTNKNLITKGFCNNTAGLSTLGQSILSVLSVLFSGDLF